MKRLHDIETGCARHLDIEEECIRPLLANQFEGGGLGPSLADNPKVGVRGKKLTKPLKGQPLVVAQNYTEHGFPSRSRVATT
ncbi:MAG: hypothetical protein EBQ51_07290 [Verrucomicrobia bacterium]|nr:hypothetical protein [Verrucomicrobiota bacterium]